MSQSVQYRGRCIGQLHTDADGQLQYRALRSEEVAAQEGMRQSFKSLGMYGQQMINPSYSLNRWHPNPYVRAMTL
ncbi:MAG TPA: hypothetical protein VEY92_08465 [Pseudoxanthomonas sp.]|nr:hypothetical protein [Pseudoxanthomonas sp.]